MRGWGGRPVPEVDRRGEFLRVAVMPAPAGPDTILNGQSSVGGHRPYTKLLKRSTGDPIWLHANSSIHTRLPIRDHNPSWPDRTAVLSLGSPGIAPESNYSRFFVFERQLGIHAYVNPQVRRSSG